MPLAYLVGNQAGQTSNTGTGTTSSPAPGSDAYGLGPRHLEDLVPWGSAPVRASTFAIAGSKRSTQYKSSTVTAPYRGVVGASQVLVINVD